MALFCRVPVPQGIRNLVRKVLPLRDKKNLGEKLLEWARSSLPFLRNLIRTTAWSSKKQSVVALSSTEAEYIAITHAAKEATWLRHLLSELYSPLVLRYPIILYSDNKSAIELVKNATFHSRTKHIAIRYHYVREAYNDGIIFLDHRGTDDMPADVFTKPLVRIKLTKFARLLGLSQT